MDFNWTAHRFVGGALAFDLANTVIMRHDPKRRRDRLAEPHDLCAFVEAANLHSAERPGQLAHNADQASNGLLALRENIDRHFRAVANGDGGMNTLAGLLRMVARRIEVGQPFGIEAATALSALKLAGDPPRGRIRICRNCGWLYLDKSKNRSRIWCDMAVCGNRQKARRHYLSSKKETSRCDG